MLEALNGVPTGLPRGARQREREVVRLRREGLSLRRIGHTLGIARGTVENDLARAAVIPSPEAIAADGKPIGRRTQTAASARNILHMSVLRADLAPTVAGTGVQPPAPPKLVAADRRGVDPTRWRDVIPPEVGR